MSMSAACLIVRAATIIDPLSGMEQLMVAASSIGRARFVLAALLSLTCTEGAVAHGFAGDRFFPATILTPDPFVADEMSLPTAIINPPSPNGSRAIDIEVDLAKRITPDLGLTLSHRWERLKPLEMPAVTGLGGTLSAELDYQFLLDAPHQAIGLVGVNAGFAHTGRVQALGAPDFTTISPAIDLGKGFGDLPESLPWLRPLAITGIVSFGFPTKTQSAGSPNPNFFILASPSNTVSNISSITLKTWAFPPPSIG
jgi:hypothetical protein